MRDGLYVKRFMKRIQPDCVVNLIMRTIDAATGTNAAKLRADGFCFKCLIEAGVQVDEIFAMPIELDAVELRRAGFSLRDLLGARNRNNRRVHHPPVTKYTLFDSQLQSAGFSAGEFRAAGYRAEQLSIRFSGSTWTLPMVMRNGRTLVHSSMLRN